MADDRKPLLGGSPGDYGGPPVAGLDSIEDEKLCYTSGGRESVQNKATYGSTA